MSNRRGRLENGHGAVLADIERDWSSVGLSGAIFARNLSTGVEIGVGADEVWSLASVIKFPIALVLYDAFDRGELDPGQPVDLDPATATSGPTGVSTFRYRSRISAFDLVGMSLAISDNAATDALLELVGRDTVNQRLREWGCTGVVVRHPMRAIYGAADAIGQLGAQVATAGYTADGGHLIAELDPRRSNAGTPRALVEMIARVWTDRIAGPAACAQLRTGMSRSMVKHRLAHELISDQISVASKTGTFGGLRHEVGLVDLGSERIAIAILTRTEIPAEVVLEADWAIGRAARLIVDQLRS